MLIECDVVGFNLFVFIIGVEYKLVCEIDVDYNCKWLDI